MPPFYPDQYNGNHEGMPSQSYYPNYTQQQPPPPPSPQFQYQPQGQSHLAFQYGIQQPIQQSPRPQIQVNNPPRSSQSYASSPIQYQHQQPIQRQYRYPSAAVPPPPLPPSPQQQQLQSQQQQQQQQQYYNQQAFNYNNQSFQQYRPPPPVQVIIPPSPISHQQSYQPSIPQPRVQHQAPQPQPVPTVAKPPQPRPYVSQTPPQPQPQPRVLQEQSNTTKQPSHPTPKSAPKTQPTTPNMNTASEQAQQNPSLLLTLADEYIDAARKLPERTEDYHILMSTALGCIQVVLKSFKLPPLRSAQLSLRYAQLLYNETNNLDDAEIVLTKAIDDCDRMKFIDLKYAMQLLLAKTLFRSKPRAAIRDLESMIQDIETYKHTAWEYPFRFQAVFFALETSTSHNIHDALQHLERIQHTAHLHSDRTVYAFAAVIESLLHLRNLGPESLSHSQQALAKARSLQLNPDIETHPQIPVIMEFIDLMWALNTAIEPTALDQKRTNLKDALYASLDGKGWTKDEMTWLRVNSKSLKGMSTQLGGLIHEMDGKYYMALSWLSKREFESLGFLLTGSALIPQNHYTHGKAEKFIAEGHKITTDDILADKDMLDVKHENANRRAYIMCICFLAELAFMRANKGNWDKTREATKSIELYIKRLGDNVPDEIKGLLDYLNGCITQGTGDLDGALRLFQSQNLALRPPSTPASTGKSQKPTTNHTLLDLQILAAMNTAFIIRLPEHPQHNHLDRLLNLLAPYFPINATRPDDTSPATSSVSATIHPVLTSTHAVLLSTLPNTTILQTKSLLAAALNSGRRVNNVQVMSLCLTLMYDRFFRGGVQDVQAVKCAKAAGHHVRTKFGSPLWGAMSGILEAESMQLVGEDIGSVKGKRDIVEKFWEVVPEGVKRNVEGK